MWSTIIPHMEEKMIRGGSCFVAVCLEIDNIRLLKPGTELNVRVNLCWIFMYS